MKEEKLLKIEFLRYQNLRMRFADHALDDDHCFLRKLRLRSTSLYTCSTGTGANIAGEVRRGITSMLWNRATEKG